MLDNGVIYFDNAATTKINKDVLDSYEKASQFYFANPSSIHGQGQSSARLVELSKKQILENINLLNSHEVIFTSGATEANNLSIIGYALAHKNRGNHIITTVYEHASVIESCKFLEKYFSFEITYLPINESGTIEVSKILSAIKDTTILVSVMAVNNEIGTINNISLIADELKQFNKIAFHVDAVQAFGKLELDYTNVDLITVASHKIHGPKGIGCVIKNNKISLQSLNNGGGQEKGERSGTLSVDLIAAFAKAFKMAKINQITNFATVEPLANKVLSYLFENTDLYEINSTHLNPFIINFSLKNKKASVVVEALSNKGIMVSSTSACNSKGEEGSRVVKALGKNEQLYNNTIRVSFDETNKIYEVEKFIETLDGIIKEIKQ